MIYAVTVRVDAAAADEWLEWMRTVHVPEILATGCFTRCDIQREVEPVAMDGRVTWVLEYLAPSIDQLQVYQRDYAPSLQRSHTERYAGRFEASRSVRQIECTLP